jgi:hypothetical protein
MYWLVLWDSRFQKKPRVSKRGTLGSDELAAQALEQARANDETLRSVLMVLREIELQAKRVVAQNCQAEATKACWPRCWGQHVRVTVAVRVVGRGIVVCGFVGLRLRRPGSPCTPSDQEALAAARHPA